MRIAAIAVVLVGAAVACSSDPHPRADVVAAPPAPAPDVPTDGFVGGALVGTVRAPMGGLPLANALVYVTDTPPAPLPDAAYCDACVTVPKGAYAISGADGRIRIDPLPSGASYVIVQKGQFRRVRAIGHAPAADGTLTGALTIPSDTFVLPGVSNQAAGDHVPKMLVLLDHPHDRIDASLRRLGVTGFDTRKDRDALYDLDTLMSHQIVFVPCGHADDPRPSDPLVQENLRKFVAAGGRLYVTDYAYEYVRQPFAGYVSWVGESATLGSAAGPEWDGPGLAIDPSLGAWLSAIGDGEFEAIGNYTVIDGMAAQLGHDPKGGSRLVTPKVWIAAQAADGVKPTTVSFDVDCGRVLFSSYHTAGDGTTPQDGLLAQEKALMHVLLEVGVCIGDGQAPPGLN